MNGDPLTDLPKPPGHLSARAKRIWRSVLERYDLDPETLASLTMALDSYDLAHTARARIKRDGHVVEGRFGLRPHPSFDVLKSSWSAWTAFVRALDLPELEGEEEPTSLRPPRDPRGHFLPRTPRGQGRRARAKRAA
jgi:hypothetical protein